MAQRPVGLLCKFLSWTGVLLTACAVQAAPVLPAPTPVIENASPSTESQKSLQRQTPNKTQAPDTVQTSTPARGSNQSQGSKNKTQTRQKISRMKKSLQKAKVVQSPQSAPKLSGSSTEVLQSMSVTKIPRVEPASESKLISGSLNFSYSRSLVDHQDGTLKNSRSVLAVLSGSLFNDYSLAGKIAYEQNLRDSEDVDSGISDLTLIFSRNPQELTHWLDGSWYMATVVPASEKSTQVENLRGVLGAGYKFSMASAVMPAGLETSFTLGASKNFYQYETDKAGQVLNSHGLKEALNVDYTYKQLKTSFEFIHRHSFAFDGNIGQSFEHTEEVGYMVKPNWKLAVGHTNAGSWLKANMQDTNLSLFNEDDSVVYGSTEVTF